MENDVKLLLDYMKGHSERLDLDINNAKQKNEINNVEFYKGAKSATEQFVRLVNDIIEKHSLPS